MTRTVKLCIDAGHGMGNSKSGVFDPGACDGGVRECDITLAWALAVKEACVTAGIPFYLIRGDNTHAVRVDQRDDLAMEHGCTHYLAIHCNAGPASATGVETFYRASDADEDLPWARAVQKAVLCATGLKDRKVKTEGESPRGRLAVLNFPPPAALVEIGFLTRLTARTILLQRATRLTFAGAIVAALLRYQDGDKYLEA